MEDTAEMESLLPFPSELPKREMETPDMPGSSAPTWSLHDYKKGVMTFYFWAMTPFFKAHGDSKVPLPQVQLLPQPQHRALRGASAGVRGGGGGAVPTTAGAARLGARGRSWDVGWLTQCELRCPWRVCFFLFG